MNPEHFHRQEIMKPTSYWPKELKVRVVEGLVNQQLKFIRQNISY